MLQSRTDPEVDRMEGWWRGLFIIIIQRHYLCSSTIKLIGLWKEHRAAAALVLNVNSSAKDMCYFLRWHTGTTKLCNNYHQQDQPAGDPKSHSIAMWAGGRQAKILRSSFGEELNCIGTCRLFVYRPQLARFWNVKLCTYSCTCTKSLSLQHVFELTSRWMDGYKIWYWVATFNNAVTPELWWQALVPNASQESKWQFGG